MNYSNAEYYSAKLIKSLTSRYRQSRCNSIERACVVFLNTGIHRQKERITSREQTQDFRWSSNKNATVKSQGLKIAC